MFDVGFMEMVLIALVALLVFGPERLPRLVRETSLWIRKARMVVASARTEIDRELQLYELKQSLEEKRRGFEREVNSLSILPPEAPNAPSQHAGAPPPVKPDPSDDGHGGA